MREIQDMGSPFCKRYSSVFEDLADGGGDGGPAAFFIDELPAAGDGEFVDAGAAVVFSGGPLGADEAGLFEAVQGGVEGAFLDAEEA